MWHHALLPRQRMGTLRVGHAPSCLAAASPPALLLRVQPRAALLAALLASRPACQEGFVGFCVREGAVFVPRPLAKRCIMIERAACFAALCRAR